MKKEFVRLGIIGLGGIGSAHARCILDDKVPGLHLAAVADESEMRRADWGDAKPFTKGSALIQSGEVDAVLIATPHYSHTTLGIEALKANLHVLIEKPISAHKADCERLIKAWTNKKLVFSAMFNQRTDPFYTRLRDLIQSGELGKIQRFNWIITDWYRTEHYYRSGEWRATWAGEGGGVLLNQCPHNLDLLQWLFGMPETITARCQFGRFHDIEVEDAVTALLEYPTGATGVFIASTGEAPGTNRLEVAGDRGKVTIEDGKFTFIRTEQSVSEHCAKAKSAFDKPLTWDINIPISNHGEQHVGILKNFTNAILNGEKLIAPAQEGIHSVELANAMLYSTFKNQPVKLPMDSAAYMRILNKKIKESKYVKPGNGTTEAADLSASFSGSSQKDGA